MVPRSRSRKTCETLQHSSPRSRRSPEGLLGSAAASSLWGRRDRNCGISPNQSVDVVPQFPRIRQPDVVCSEPVELLDNHGQVPDRIREHRRFTGPFGDHDRLGRIDPAGDRVVHAGKVGRECEANSIRSIRRPEHWWPRENDFGSLGFDPLPRPNPATLNLIPSGSGPMPAMAPSSAIGGSPSWLM